MNRWGRLALAAAALAAGLGGAVAGGPPLVAAHRGGALLWPENSLQAFRGALGLGVELLETDVHLTADGEVIVLHDATLDRTTTGSGAVRDLPLAEVRRLRLRAGSLPTDEPVPTLDELLDVLAPGRAELLLEIKVGADQQRYPGIEEKVLALLRGRALVDRTLVMAFQPETVRRVRELDRSVRTVLLVGRGQVQRERARPAELVRRALDAGAGALGINHRLLDAEVVAEARRAGITLAAWTVNEEADLQRVLTLGVDVVITDRPDLALRLRGR